MWNFERKYPIFNKYTTARYTTYFTAFFQNDLNGTFEKLKVLESLEGECKLQYYAF